MPGLSHGGGIGFIIIINRQLLPEWLGRGYQFDTQYETSDTTFIDPLSWTYPSYVDTEVSINALEVNVGQGLSIALKNMRSVSLELMLIKQFGLASRFRNSSSLAPKSEPGITGVKLAVLMNF